MRTDSWFWLSMILVLGVLAMAVGFGIGKQSAANECKRFGMFYNSPSSTTYSCQLVQADDVVVTDFREVMK